jgi:ketosteroid isomerase-like protein
MESGTPPRDTGRASSEENIQTVRRACEAWGTGDISIYRQMYATDATAYAGSLAPEVVGEMTGAEEIIGLLESLLDSFEESELVPSDFIAEGDVLVARVLMRARPHGTSGRIEWPLSVCYRFKDGLITHQAWYTDHEEALEAAGVRE